MVVFFERYNKRRPTSLGTLVGILLLSISLVEQVYADGKQISEYTVDPNRLII
jgi:hypothetical protein